MIKLQWKLSYTEALTGISHSLKRLARFKYSFSQLVICNIFVPFDNQ